MPSNTAKALVAGLALVGAAAGVQAGSRDPAINDGQALNYALGLEHLEAAFYVKGLGQYTAAQFAAAGYPQSVYDYVTLIGAHETAHVSFLRDAIGSGAGVACQSYSFTANGFTSVDNFLATAITLEDVGVGAYTAALNHIANTGTQQAAATIATIEARHAAYLRAVAGNATSAALAVPFPAGVNAAILPDDVVTAATQFFTPPADDCKNFLSNLPAVRPTGVSTNSTRAAFFNSSVLPASGNVYTQAQFDEDLNVLNYALTLEHLEASFYNTFNFDAAAYNGVSGLSGRGASIVPNIALVKAHENAHVAALQSIITGRGGTPVTAGCYNWTSITTATQFLAVAQTLENTGVSAYDGAANRLTDTGLQQIAASVATVEARHAQYIQLLNNQLTQTGGLNAARDTPLTADQIVTAVTALPYVVGGRLTGGCTGGSTTGPNGGNTGTTNNGGGSTAPSSGGDPGSGSFVAPIAIVSTLLAVVSALLF